MMKIKNIKVGISILVQSSIKLFRLLCFFFASYVNSQTIYGDVSNIFIEEGTKFSVNKKSKSTIYITEESLFSDLERIKNVEIVYIKHFSKEKKHKYTKTSLQFKKEKRQKVNTPILSKTLDRINEQLHTISLTYNGGAITSLSVNDHAKQCVLYRETGKLKLFKNKKEKLTGYPFSFKNSYYFNTNKIRPPPQMLHFNFSFDFEKSSENKIII